MMGVKIASNALFGSNVNVKIAITDHISEGIQCFSGNSMSLVQVWSR